MKKYYGGCDVGSTYTKCVILDEEGNIAAHTTIKSKINPSESSVIAMDETVNQVEELKSPEDLAYLIGTGYGRNKVPFADENISEISCHAMGVHVTNPEAVSYTHLGQEFSAGKPGGGEGYHDPCGAASAAGFSVFQFFQCIQQRTDGGDQFLHCIHASSGSFGAFLRYTQHRDK